MNNIELSLNIGAERRHVLARLRELYNYSDKAPKARIVPGDPHTLIETHAFMAVKMAFTEILRKGLLVDNQNASLIQAYITRIDKMMLDRQRLNHSSQDGGSAPVLSTQMERGLLSLFNDELQRRISAAPREQKDEIISNAVSQLPADRRAVLAQYFISTAPQTRVPAKGPVPEDMRKQAEAHAGELKFFIGAVGRMLGDKFE